MAIHSATGILPVDDARVAKTPTRVSWGAIFAGVVLAIAIQLVLGILGTGIGLTLVDPVEGTTPGATGFGIGAGLYWIITTILALGAGGYAAARVAGVHDRFDGLVHGLVVWGVTLILTLYLLTSAVGGIIGGAFRTVGSVATAAGSGIGAAAPKVADVAAKVLREQFQQPRPTTDEHEGLLRDLGDYDRAFGLVDDPVGGLVDGMSTDESSDGLTDGEVA